MSIITKVTKYKLLEWTIDSIFNGIEKNFKRNDSLKLTINDIYIGQYFSKIIYYCPDPTIDHINTIFKECKITYKGKNDIKFNCAELILSGEQKSRVSKIQENGIHKSNFIYCEFYP